MSSMIISMPTTASSPEAFWSGTSVALTSRRGAWVSRDESVPPQNAAGTEEEAAAPAPALALSRDSGRAREGLAGRGGVAPADAHHHGRPPREQGPRGGEPFRPVGGEVAPPMVVEVAW